MKYNGTMFTNGGNIRIVEVIAKFTSVALSITTAQRITLASKSSAVAIVIVVTVVQSISARAVTVTTPVFMRLVSLEVTSYVACLVMVRYCRMNTLGAKLIMFCSPHPEGMRIRWPRFWWKAGRGKCNLLLWCLPVLTLQVQLLLLAPLALTHTFIFLYSKVSSHSHLQSDPRQKQACSREIFMSLPPLKCKYITMASCM